MRVQEKKIFNIILLVLLIGCSTVSKKVTYENNKFKNNAKDYTKMANELVQKFEYSKALEYLKESLKYNIIADNFEGIIKNYLDIAKVYILLKDKDTTLFYYEEALKFFNNEETNYKNKFLEADLYTSLGEGYYLLNDYTKARDSFDKALQIEKLFNREENIANIYYYISRIEKNSNNISKSLEYLLMAETILEKLYKDKKLNNINKLANIYYSIGINYFKNQKFSDAKKYIFKALDIDRMTENSSGIADDYYALAMLSEKENNLDKALFYFKKAKNIYKLIEYFENYKEVMKKIIDIQYNLTLYRDYIESIKEIISISKDNEKKKYIDLLLNSLKDEKIKTTLKDKEIEELSKIK